MKKIFTFFAVAMMALASQATVLTVAEPAELEEAYYSQISPICGLYADTYGTQVQTIYPAEMLADMAGKQITQVQFYTLNVLYEKFDLGTYTDATDYINFNNAKIQLSFKEVDENGYTDVVAITGATAVATAVPVSGDQYLTFVLDEPFTYTGKNLMVETLVIEEGTWGETYFGGMSTDPTNCGYYSIDGNVNITAFMPMTSFTYEAGNTPVEPTEKTDAPSSLKTNYVYNDGNMYYNAYTVVLSETEPSDIYYRVGIMVDGEFVYGDWMLYTGELNFDDEGTYMVEAYAIAPNKTESDHIWDGFTVSKLVDVEEILAGKAVAGVRYFNMAGQEMQQANGLTIVVTTYTDGTTTSAKVMK